MDEDKPKLGFEVAQELRREFMKIGTAGYPIRILNESTGQIFSITGYKTEKVDSLPDATSPNQYQTWILIEEEN